MNARFSLISGLLFIGMISVNRVDAQDDMLIKVNQSLTAMQIALTNKNHSMDSAKANHIQTDVNRISGLLNGLITSIMKADSIEGHLYSSLLLEIKNYRDLFDQVAKSDNPDSISEILSFVAEDLNLKYTGAYASTTDVSSEFVSVRIRVFKDSTMNELPGYITHVKPVWSVNKEQEEVFNPTRNAVKSLVPGKKLFWIERNGIIIQKRVERIRVGETHGTQIDFVVTATN